MAKLHTNQLITLVKSYWKIANRRPRYLVRGSIGHEKTLIRGFFCYANWWPGADQPAKPVSDA